MTRWLSPGARVRREPYLMPSPLDALRVVRCCRSSWSGCIPGGAATRLPRVRFLVLSKERESVPQALLAAAQGLGRSLVESRAEAKVPPSALLREGAKPQQERLS